MKFDNGNYVQEQRWSIGRVLCMTVTRGKNLTLLTPKKATGMLRKFRIFVF